MTREVLSFQLGHISNFVGTHWWNLQEASFVYEGGKSNEKAEINHDVTFREGLTLKDEVTYTPRLISVDLGDALQNLKLDGVLYDLGPEEDRISWSHEVTIHQEVKHKKNDFLRDLDTLDNPEQAKIEAKMEACSSKEEMEIDEVELDKKSTADNITEKVYDLDSSVRSWCDYLRLHLHPKTLSVIKGYYQSDDSFNIHGFGANLYNNQSLDLRTELEDKIHFFAEESDHLQGFHMLADIYDGFGGVASSLASDLRDEFAKRGCISFCPFPSWRSSQENSHSLHDLINTVLTVVKLTKEDFTVVPLSMVNNPWKSSHLKHTQLPGITYKSHLPYHTSAIFAAALDTATLSHRLLQGSVPLAHLTDTLSSSGRMISNLSVAFPLPLEPQLSMMNMFTKALNPLISLTPLYDINATRAANVQSVVFRGAKASCESLLQESVSKWTPYAESCILEVQRPCNVKAPFPHLFDGGIDEYGYRKAEMLSKTKAVQNVAAMTSLSTTNQSEPMLSHLLERSEKLSQRHLHKHLDAGMELDDWSEVVNDLRELTKRYLTEDTVYDMSSSDE